MRLGVLDAGSTTVHLLVVDAPRGGHPTPGLRQLINFTSRMAASDRAELEGVSEAEGRVLVGGRRRIGLTEDVRRQCWTVKQRRSEATGDDWIR